MRPSTSRSLPALVLAATLALGAPAARGGAEGGDPAPPAPPAPAEGKGDAEGRPDGGTGDAVRVTEPPLTLETALHRIRGLREMPLRGPGSLRQRVAKIRDLAERALALPAAESARGEDLYRVGELRLVARDYPGAAAALRAYLAGGEPRAEEAGARVGLVRALALQGKPADALALFEALLAAGPAPEDAATAGVAVAEALVRAGDIGKAADVYGRAAAAAAGHPGALTALQGRVEALACLGRNDEARAAIAAAAPGSGPADGARLEAMLRRVDLAGHPLPPLTLPHWGKGAAPTAEDLRGRVVVWHVFAAWMESRLEELDRWVAEAGALRERGLVLLPLTRTAGWIPGAPAMDRSARSPAAEAKDIERLLAEHGWSGNVGIAFGATALEPLDLRGLPMDIVVGRDGRVIFARASGEVGLDLALHAARRALDAPPPPPGPPGSTAPSPGAADAAAQDPPAEGPAPVAR